MIETPLSRYLDILQRLQKAPKPKGRSPWTRSDAKVWTAHELRELQRLQDQPINTIKQHIPNRTTTAIRRKLEEQRSRARWV